jgi:cobalt-zinc-cadmium efflux system protein
MTDMAKNTIKSSSNIKKLKIVFLLSSFYFVSAVIIVLITGSLSLLSEAGHMLADIGGFALALFAINYSRKLPTPERTYGFFRIEILASLTNSVILILLSLYIIYEGFMRIFAPPEIHGFPIIVAAVVGLIVNFISMYMLSDGKGVFGHSHGHSKNAEEQNLNVKAIYLETLSDTIGAAGVLAAGLIMVTTRFYLADPIISIGLALFMIPRTWSIIKKAVHILMEGSPYNIPHDKVKEAILKIRGVTGLFELHIWTITSGMHALSAHVVIIDPSRSQEILQEINSILEKKFKITHATIQLERYHSESNLFKP